MPEPRGPEEYQEQIKRIVDSVPGAIAASIVGADGISLAGFSHVANFDFTLVDAELSTVQRAARNAMRGMTAGEVDEVVVVATKATFLIRPAGRDFYISITLRGDQNLGIARLVAKKMAQDLGRMLSP